MPPRRLRSSTNASAPYCGPTNAPGSNALLRLLMVPSVMVVGVTPTSDAVLRGAPGAATPVPGPTVVTSTCPAAADGVAEAPGSGDAVPASPAGAALEVVTCGPSACSAAVKARSGSRVPHALSRVQNASTRTGARRTRWVYHVVAGRQETDDPWRIVAPKSHNRWSLRARTSFVPARRRLCGDPA